MSYEHLKYEVSERILTITLNRPDRMNAFNIKMGEELVEALNRANEDDNIRVIIVTGAPEARAFCAGMDLASGADTFKGDSDSAVNAENWGRDKSIALTIFKLNKPIIAAINGAAAGIGLTITLPMDIRIASSNAKMGFVFCRRGIAPESCSSYFLPRIVGIAQALRWVFSGRVFPAQEALDGGLVSQVVAPEELIPTARAIAKEIADNTAPVSVAVTRQLLWRMLGEIEHPVECFDVETKLIPWLGQRPDAAEGVKSFIEKRNPQFTMSPSKDTPYSEPWWPFKDK